MVAGLIIIMVEVDLVVEEVDLVVEVVVVQPLVANVTIVTRLVIKLLTVSNDRRLKLLMFV